ncbi:hypothetical protein HMPREF9418_2387 [Neisseria macacae ATCC 33926]|uniref:Uncharacterized protein n=1 Tax=Neisseria macacae ATCC 33926 TaxID=997348 RepID=A0AA36XJI0_9NEIS|nr:hypothetical protein HMPREF9418_2387 [Neisseria macacae ATCC 33926]
MYPTKTCHPKNRRIRESDLLKLSQFGAFRQRPPRGICLRKGFPQLKNDNTG